MTVNIPTPEELRAESAARRARWSYASQPYTVTWCDSEHGIASFQDAHGNEGVHEYESWCSIPVHKDVFYAEVTEDCHCGGLDPAIEHPCIGHDPRTGEPYLGPSWFIDPTDKQANWSAGL
jgi:hypothetical protein